MTPKIKIHMSNEELIKGLSHIVDNDGLTDELYLKKQYARLERIREGTEESDLFVSFEEYSLNP